MKRYSDSEIEFIKNNLDKGNKEIGLILGRASDGIKHRIKLSGLKRTKHQIKALRQSNNTGQFKKGNLPHNTNYNGHRRITKDGYIEVRVKKGLYRLEHLYNWERLYGKIPDNHCLACIDGNKLNTNPGNWKLITRSENMLRNTIQRYPKELIKAIKLISNINNRL